MKSFVLIQAVFVAAVLFSQPISAKGRTVQVTITGPSIETTLHSSAESLISANIWGSNHIDWDTGPIDRAVGALPVYLIHFWAELPRGPIQIKYVLGYRWDSELNRAIVCLPGRQNPWYNVNVSSIIYGNEGKCFLASEQWGAAVRAVLPVTE